jgi:hypothetical protein
MTQPTQLDLDALQAAAEAATPGIWTTYKDGSEKLNNRCNVVESGCAMVAYGQLSDEDANFIAAANPAVVLALIDRLRKAEAEAGLYREYYEADRAYETLHDHISPGLTAPTDAHYAALSETTKRFCKARDAIAEMIAAAPDSTPTANKEDACDPPSR